MFTFSPPPSPAWTTIFHSPMLAATRAAGALFACRARGVCRAVVGMVPAQPEVETGIPALDLRTKEHESKGLDSGRVGAGRTFRYSESLWQNSC
jgi:hypothetical protein